MSKHLQLLHLEKSKTPIDSHSHKNIPAIGEIIKLNTIVISRWVVIAFRCFFSYSFIVSVSITHNHSSICFNWFSQYPSSPEPFLQTRRLGFALGILGQQKDPTSIPKSGVYLNWWDKPRVSGYPWISLVSIHGLFVVCCNLKWANPRESPVIMRFLFRPCFGNEIIVLGYTFGSPPTQ